jgi:hypothetical protein
LKDSNTISNTILQHRLTDRIWNNVLNVHQQ